jgi:FtsH-binding integral membrane protein
LELLLGNALVFYGLLILEVAMVWYLSARVMKMSVTQASAVFFAYSVLNGVTLSLIFLVYTMASISSVFLVSAGMFGLVSMYGFMTKKDLTTVGHYAFMGLVGIILASIVNIFIRNDGFNLILSYISVVIFVALTAYDTQKLKALNSQVAIGSEVEKKASIMGALTLYLDFINLFLNLLRIMGRRR